IMRRFAGARRLSAFHPGHGRTAAPAKPARPPWSASQATPRTHLMRSRLFWRRSAAAAGTYSSAVLGFLGTIVAYHVFSTRTFGLYAIVLAAAGFFQTLLDLTMEEALIKFGFRYVTREDWGRLRRLFSSAVRVK